MPEAEESIVSSKPLALRTTTGRIGGGDEGGATVVTGKLVGRLKIGTGDSKDFIWVFDNAFRNGNECIEFGPSGVWPTCTGTYMC